MYLSLYTKRAMAFSQPSNHVTSAKILYVFYLFCEGPSQDFSTIYFAMNPQKKMLVWKYIILCEMKSSGSANSSRIISNIQLLKTSWYKKS